MKTYYNKEGLLIEKWIWVNGKPVPIYEKQYDMTSEEKILRDKIRDIQSRADTSFKSSHNFRIAGDMEDIQKKINKLPNGKFKDRMTGWLTQIKQELNEREE